jgi:RNA polymerase sigma-70 factor (ECF subfamily)
MVSQRDQKWIDEALSGSNAAYSDLLNAYWSAVFGHLLQKTKNTEDVQDLCMVTFTKAFRRMETFDGNHAFVTWLYSIADNTFIDFVRKKELDTTRLDSFFGDEEDEGLDVADEHPDPESALIGEQKEQQIRKLIKGLPTDYQRIVELRYIHERAYEEISDELEIPMGTVKTKLFRARNLLKEIFRSTFPGKEIL